MSRMGDGAIVLKSSPMFKRNSGLEAMQIQLPELIENHFTASLQVWKQSSVIAYSAFYLSRHAMKWEDFHPYFSDRATSLTKSGTHRSRHILSLWLCLGSTIISICPRGTTYYNVTISSRDNMARSLLFLNLFPKIWAPHALCFLRIHPPLLC